MILCSVVFKAGALSDLETFVAVLAVSFGWGFINGWALRLVWSAHLSMLHVILGGSDVVICGLLGTFWTVT